MSDEDSAPGEASRSSQGQRSGEEARSARRSHSDYAPSPGRADPLDLRGVVAPTLTAFDEDGSLDAAGTAAHARFVVDSGVSAVFPLGTNGEFPLLSDAERATVVEAVVDEVGGEVPVIAGVGAPGTRRTVANAEAALAAGADGLVVVTPYYYPLDDDAVVRHFERVLAATDSPVYVYNLPGKTGNAVSLDALDRLAEAGIAGVKDSSKDVPWLGQAVDGHPELTFLAGSDSLVFPGLQIGCTGVVSAVANAFPAFVVELYEAYAGGALERARHRQGALYQVRDALKRGPYMAGVKTALDLREDGPDGGPLREPLRAMNDAERAALAEELHELGLL